MPNMSTIVLLDSIVLWCYSEAAYNLFSWEKSVMVETRLALG